MFFIFKIQILERMLVFAFVTIAFTSKSRKLIVDEDHHVGIKHNRHEDVDDNKIDKDQEEQVEQRSHNSCT